MNIPDSCKWSSKKRNRKSFEEEQQKKVGGKIDNNDDNKDVDDGGNGKFRRLSQTEKKPVQIDGKVSHIIL